MSDKINTVDDWNVDAIKEDVKKVILTYVKDTKQIEKNKFDVIQRERLKFKIVCGLFY